MGLGRVDISQYNEYQKDPVIRRIILRFFWSIKNKNAFLRDIHVRVFLFSVLKFSYFPQIVDKLVWSWS